MIQGIGMWNPIRRNRKIGKTQGGRVKAGVAREKSSRRPAWKWCNTAKPSDRFHYNWDRCKQIPGDPCPLVEENPAHGYHHPCTGAEVLDVLRRLPENIRGRVRFVLLAQPPRNAIKRAVLGRHFDGCVILYSQPDDLGESPLAIVESDDQDCIQPWCRSRRRVGSEWHLSWTSEEMRNFYSFHVLLHEIGHATEGADEERAERFTLKWARRLRSYPRRLSST